jgi:hypothetical protein
MRTILPVVGTLMFALSSPALAHAACHTLSLLHPASLSLNIDGQQSSAPPNKRHSAPGTTRNAPSLTLATPAEKGLHQRSLIIWEDTQNDPPGAKVQLTTLSSPTNRQLAPLDDPASTTMGGRCTAMLLHGAMVIAGATEKRTLTAPKGASCKTADGTTYPDGSVINSCLIYGARTCNTAQQLPLQAKCINGSWHRRAD